MDSADNPIARVAQVLREKGLDKGRIGVEWRHIEMQFAEDLREHLPMATLVDAEPVLWEMRIIKSEEEISRIQTGMRQKWIIMGCDQERWNLNSRYELLRTAPAVVIKLSSNSIQWTLCIKLKVLVGFSFAYFLNSLCNTNGSKTYKTNEKRIQIRVIA